MKKLHLKIVMPIAALLLAGLYLAGQNWPTLTGQITSSQVEIATKEATVARGRVTYGVTETGTVGIGTETQTFDVDLSALAGTSALGSTDTAEADYELRVESVLVQVGQVIKAGEPLLQLKSSDVASIRLALEDAVSTAQFNLSDATITRDKAKLAAQYDYEAHVALGTTAQAQYDATLAQLNIDVAEAEKNLADANERIAEIPGEISDLADEIDDLDDDTQSAQILNLENEMDDLASEKADLTASLPTLQLKINQANRDRTSGSAAAKALLSQSNLLYKNAKATYQVALNSVDDEVATAQDALDTAQSNLDDFNAAVSDTSVLAKYSGTLTEMGYSVNDSLNSSTAIATIQNASEVTVEVDVAQDDISVVNIGDTVHIEFSAYPDETYDAVVSSINASVTDMRTSTVSYPVTVTLSGDVAKIFDGMTGNVTFIKKEVTDVLYVSNKAIINEGTKSYVKRKSADGTIEKKAVETGFSNGYQVEIKSGLAEGDIVIIESQVKQA